MKTKVSIADDHIMVINGLEKMLEGSSVEVISTYNKSTHVLEGLAIAQPDVLLLDIQMPILSGEELMPQLSKAFPELKIIIITGFDDIYYVTSMMQLGASGYVLKSSSKEVILNAINAAIHGEQYIDPAIADQHGTVHRNQKPHIQKVSLSPREKEVLQLTAEGLSSNEIAEKLFLGKRTIENYRMSLLLKLDVKNVAMLVKKAIELRLI